MIFKNLSLAMNETEPKSKNVLNYYTAYYSLSTSTELPWMLLRKQALCAINRPSSEKLQKSACMSNFVYLPPAAWTTVAAVKSYGLNLWVVLSNVF